jgi:hypothetical protein
MMIQAFKLRILACLKPSPGHRELTHCLSSDGEAIFLLQGGVIFGSGDLCFAKRESIYVYKTKRRQCNGVRRDGMKNASYLGSGR